jgi:hydroxyacylglutathione hydrolase
MLEIKPVAAFRDNYIWLLINPVNQRAAIVDPGDTEPVLAALRDSGLQACAILLTHHHQDHVGGVSGLLEQFTVPVYGPATENIPTVSTPLRDGDRIHIAELAAEFRILSIPGHTRGHIAYFGHGALFCGDTLFMAGCGRLFEGTARQMLASLDQICKLPDETLVYCGHEYTLANLRFAGTVEPQNADIQERNQASAARRDQGQPTVPATLALEKLTNPFLRVRVPAVQAAAMKHAGKTLIDPVSIFAEVRAWKDNF